MKSMFSLWLEEQRNAGNMTKGIISEKIGVAVGQYTAYILGRSVPRAATLERISRAFDVPVEELRRMLNTPEPPEYGYDGEYEDDQAEEAYLLRSKIIAAQYKVIDGKQDLIIAMLSDISNQLSLLESN